MTSTVVAVLTPAGRGAIATVGVRGPRAVEIVAACFQSLSGRWLTGETSGRIVVGQFRGLAGPAEELVVGLIGPEEVEVHCHGGTAAVAAVVESLQSQGATQIDWQEWIASEESDAIAQEARLALANARTERTAAILLDQYRGALRAEVERIAELASGQREPPGSVQRELLTLLARSDLGLHLTDPRHVVIAGPPNVGKSSLINALLGYERAIVFDEPGTTRDVLTAHTAIEGWLVELADTAGLRESCDEIEAEGVARARARIACADLVLLVTDLSRASEPADERWLDLVCRVRPPERVMIVHNKNDAALRGVPAGNLAISARTGQGIRELLHAIAERLVPDPPPPGAAVPFTARQVQHLREALEAWKRGDAQVAAVTLDSLINPP